MKCLSNPSKQQCERGMRRRRGRNETKRKSAATLLKLINSDLVVVHRAHTIPASVFQRVPFPTTQSHSVPSRVRRKQNVSPQSVTSFQCFDKLQPFIKTRDEEEKKTQSPVEPASNQRLNNYWWNNQLPQCRPCTLSFESAGHQLLMLIPLCFFLCYCLCSKKLSGFLPSHKGFPDALR